MMSCQTNGKAMTRLPRPSTRCATTWEPLRRWVTRSVTVHPPPLEPELEGRQQPDEQEDDHRDRRRVALVVGHEPLAVEEVDERHAAGQHRVAAAEDRVEQVEHLEARDDGDD